MNTRFCKCAINIMKYTILQNAPQCDITSIYNGVAFLTDYTQTLFLCVILPMLFGSKFDISMRWNPTCAFYYYRMKFLVEKMFVSIMETLLQIREIVQLLIYLLIKRNGTLQTNLQMNAFSAFSGSARPEQHNRSWRIFENVKYTTTLLGNGLCPHLLPFHLFISTTRQPYAYKYSMDRTAETHLQEARWIQW